MYEVEAIVGKRVNAQTNHLEYQVKWFNYPAEENTWQPERNLKFVKNLIDEFNKKTQIKGDLGLVAVGNYCKAPKKQEETVKSEQKNMNNQICDSDLDQGGAGIFFQEESSKEDDQLEGGYNTSKDQQSTSKKRDLAEPRSGKYQTVAQRKQNMQKQRQRNDQQEASLKVEQKNEKEGKSIKNSMEGKDYLRSEKNFQFYKKTPPLPPDFAINKQRYIDPENLKAKQIGQATQMKRKLIEKARNKGTSNRRNQHQLRPVVRQQKIPSTELIPDIIHLKPSSNNPSLKMANTVLPSFISQQSMPILQQNYFSNQYQLYNHRPPHFYFPKPALHLNFAQPVPNFEKGDSHRQGENRNYKYESRELLEKSNKKSEDRVFKVLEVSSMEKTDSGYIYLAETTQGTVWLSRDELVPRYSSVLLQFYERHLRFD